MASSRSSGELAHFFIPYEDRTFQERFLARCTACRSTPRRQPLAGRRPCAIYPLHSFRSPSCSSESALREIFYSLLVAVSVVSQTREDLDSWVVATGLRSCPGRRTCRPRSYR